MPKTKKLSTGVGRIEYRTVPIGTIRPASYNPRVDLQPGDEEYERLKKSIEKFTTVEPLVWNEKTGNLVGGHQRLKVLVNEFGATEVDVSVVQLTDIEEKALNIALNKIGSAESMWDSARLGDVLAEIQNDDTIDEILTGFDAEEISAQFEVAMETMFDELDGTSADDILGGDLSGGDGLGDNGKQAAEAYGVLVNCKGEDQQRQVYEALKTRGFSVRLMTM